MNIVESARLQMFKGVHQFGHEHAGSIPASGHASGLLALVAGAITEIEVRAAAQVSGVSSVRETTTTKAFVRSNLLDEVEEINRIARAISIQTPGVLERFRLPESNSDQALLTSARAFAKEALPLKAEFTKRSLAATFIEDLENAATRFEESMNQRHSSRESRVAATAAMDEPFEQGMKAVRELKLIMPILLKNDPAALAAWRSASHVERHTARKTANAALPGGSSDVGGTPGSIPGKA